MSTMLRVLVLAPLILHRVFSQNIYGLSNVWPQVRMNSVTSLGQIGFVIAADSGKIFRSTDLGMSWAVQNNAGGNSIGLGDVWFTSENLGYASGGIGKILKTSDGGISWIAIPSPVSVNLEAVAFATPLIGVAIGARTAIRTTNGGQNWIVSPLGYASIHDIAFGSSNQGVVVGQYTTFNGRDFYQDLFRTTDAGGTWTPVGYTFGFLFGVASFGTSNYIAVGDYGRIVRSTDGGASWTIVNSGTSMRLISAGFADSLYGIAVGFGNTICITTDGGATWNAQTVSTGGASNYVSIAFVGSTAILIGDRGIPLRSTDKGSHWTTSSILSVYPIESSSCSFFLSQNFPNPFNPSTSLMFGIGKSAFVTLKVYDIIGREVATLVDEVLSEGTYSQQFVAKGLTSGVYFFQLRSGDFIQTKRMLFIQ